jgi:predicted MFS family arabinose efflux permease
VLVLYLFGAAGNLLNISINTQGVSIEALYNRSIMASFHGVWSLAGFTGAAIGTVMVSQSVSPFTHFCIVSALVIIGIALGYRYLLTRDISGGGSTPIFARPDKVILKLGLIAMCCMICEGTMFDWSGVYFRKVVHAPRELTTLGYVAFMSTMAGGRFAGDWLSTHFGKKKLIQMSGLIIATGLMIAVLFPYLLSSTLGFLLVGMGVSSVVPLVYGAAGKSKTMSAGMALAAVSTIGYIGFLMGPPLIGFIAQAASLRLSFSVIAVLGLFTSILALNARLDE